LQSERTTIIMVEKIIFKIDDLGTHSVQDVEEIDLFFFDSIDSRNSENIVAAKT
jgi:hypothetical protein